MNTLPAIPLTLDRLSYNKDGTPGTLRVGPHTFATLELPISRTNDQPSCLLPGVYELAYTARSTGLGQYMRANGDDRTSAVFRVGNFMGSLADDFQADHNFGILVGRAAVLLNMNHATQRAVVLSASTYAAILAALTPHPVLLTINPPMSERNVIYPPRLNPARR